MRELEEVEASEEDAAGLCALGMRWDRGFPAFYIRIYFRVHNGTGIDLQDKTVLVREPINGCVHDAT